MPRDNRGMTLLEILVALAVVATAGVSLVAALGATARAQRSAELAERTTAEASRVLAAVSLLSRADLDRRLGLRAIGRFEVGVQRPEPALYRIAIAERETPAVELLVTVVHRPVPVAP